MAGDRSARRSSRAKRARDEDSDDPEMSAAVQLTRLDSTNDGVSRESDRLAKIQEKNRKAQQKCGSTSVSCDMAKIRSGVVLSRILMRTRKIIGHHYMQVSGTPQRENAYNGARGMVLALHAPHHLGPSAWTPVFTWDAHTDSRIE